MKYSLCLSVLVAFSLLNCDLFARGGELPPSTPLKHGDAALFSSPED